MPFHRPTITSEDEPIPRRNRPGAALASAAALWASRAGPRVNTGRMAVPRRSSGAQAAARASGVSPSVSLASADHASV